MELIDSYLALVGAGQAGWGPLLLTAAAMTIGVSVCGFLAGTVIGSVVTFMQLSRHMAVRWCADCYTTILRGVPDLLIIYLFYFGGSSLLGSVGGLFGYHGFIGMPAFLTGTLALGVVSAAYQAEVFRGAFKSVARGELEAASAVGMRPWPKFRRIIAPLVLRYAIPGLGNTWQLVLKESALISVTGLVELLRQSQIAAGSTRRPFEFYLTAVVLYLVITWVSSILFKRMEARTAQGIRRAL
ncbi:MULTISPECIES: ABC transporter permease [Rhizobium]|uniref:ABC transporter permease subunit n=1 Tax=Rhizobium tropici TaxID=398 RepID=A0A6P1C2S3_RHITR|nr:MULTISPECIES: ABC transporter permease subunit [Rhizobium]AGB75101.1 putative amino acid ABC transporter, permease protein [Rhizobium tropici CIAT 899]MBB4242955.1 octopine/nopaline transport system permease protein [Rhizobium tropici]MBB5594630.1 octopine/nopaline transport system permease protein [Rhizobium tropici]MBB6493281.1 octopine/nopaline transport system permease protein [Rhizobium tropici]NEV11490.1 ABC transporter permease subunit [Rhizobium tropici]